LRRKKIEKMYDKNNIFAKILRGELSCRKVYEDKFVFSFYDINPKAKIHALVIPRGEYKDLVSFITKASIEEIIGFFNGLNKVIEKLGISDDGFRCIINNGHNGSQEVPHLHFHILGGEKFGRIV